MNQDQVKEILISIENAPEAFTLVFSGKKSTKVNGLYKPEIKEILIHNKNFIREMEGELENKQFCDDNLLLYTAIHEYTHHLHACSRGGKLPSRAHSSEFWAIFHRLLEKAETQGVYKNVFASLPELTELTELIRTKYLAENGALVKELGEVLVKAHDLCLMIGGRFEDYVDRVLRIPRLAATTAIKMYQYDLNPAVGSDNMRFLAGIRNEEKRTVAESALLEGKSPDTVKIEIKTKQINAPATVEVDPSIALTEGLKREKERLQRAIASLSEQLIEIERKLTSMEQDDLNDQRVEELEQILRGNV